LDFFHSRFNPPSIQADMAIGDKPGREDACLVHTRANRGHSESRCLVPVLAFSS
jgi:hypothetical protein